MCGRFVLHTPMSKVAARYWGVEKPVGDMVSRYNISPGKQIQIVRKNAEGHPDFLLSHWGFKPQWVGEVSSPPFNASIEKLHRSEYFQEAFSLRRCVIPASGWYAWQEKGGAKIPHYITAANLARDQVLFFAGIYEYTGRGVSTCVAIITEPATGNLQTIQNRQPVLISSESLNTWMDPTITSISDLRGHINRLSTDTLTYWQVSNVINNPSKEGNNLIERP